MKGLKPITTISRVVVIITLFSIGKANLAHAESLSLNQCANGGIADPVSHLECHEGWINGNLNKSKAAFAEGDFVPYRVRMTGLTPGSQYTYEFSWDTLKDGKHAIEYIGTYNHSVTGANACDGAAGTCPGTVSTHLIPIDLLLPAQTMGDLTLFGGTIDSVGPYSNTTDPSLGAQSITVTFTPDQANAVLAWGGHIASPLDWGEPSASDIKGSPYHVSNVDLKNSEGQSVAGGRQDVQLSAAAVFVPSAINVTKSANAPGTFLFESTFNGGPLLPDDDLDLVNPWPLDRGQTRTLDVMDDGTAVIGEIELPEGMWRVRAVSCEQLGVGNVYDVTFPAEPPTTSASVELEVGAASTIDCVFENEFFGAPVLTVIKKVVGLSDACSDTVRDSLDFELRHIHSGEEIKFCYWVNNTGGDAALDIDLIDDMGGLGVPTEIVLSGATNEDDDGLDDDLAVGGWVSGNLTVAANIPLNTQVLNTATTNATGKTLGQPVSASDTAAVIADQASVCTVNASVYAGTGNCAANGQPTAYILKDSGNGANWCADLDWDASAALDLINIIAELQGEGVSAGGSDLSPGGSQVIEVGNTTPNADFTGTVLVTGSEGDLNPISCEGTATVNVVDPGLFLLKLASTDDQCGNSDDALEVEIIHGDPVWYCLSVMNTGDTDLADVQISDPTALNAPIIVGDLPAPPDSGSTQTFISSAQYPSEDTPNTATADATEPLTGTPLQEMSTANVIVLAADVEVDKSVSPSQIVLCDGVDDPEGCSEPNGGGNYDTVYTIKVTNNGPSIATGVSVTDTLPDEFIYSSDNGACIYDEPSHSLNCDLGNMAPAQMITIEVTGEIDVSGFDLPWQRVTNQTCANTTPPRLDPDGSNNCDQASTQISTGPTRTIGWWRTHPNGLQACLDASNGSIDLGFLTIRDEARDGDVDATVSTDPVQKGKFKSSLMTAEVRDDKDGVATSALVMAKGMMNAHTTNWGDGTKRSRIGQERVKASRQLTASWCNEAVFLSDFDEYFLSWDDIRKIMAGQAYLEGGSVIDCGGSCAKQLMDKVINSIGYLGGISDQFNNAGDDLDIPLPPEPANPHAPEDDPTNPFD